MERKNYYALDVAKLICALLVICIHTGPLLDVNIDANFVLVQVLARLAVPLFFVISGFLFFQKIDLQREWNDYENMKALKHYVWRLCKVYFIWTILYLPFVYILMMKGDGITFVSIIRFLRDVVFNGSYYHLWFLPALIFASVLAYFLVFKLRIKGLLALGGALYILGMIGNIYPFLYEQIPLINKLWKGYVRIFSTTRNGLFFGLVYVSIGAYFANKKWYPSRSYACWGFVISFILYVVECCLIRYFGFMEDLVSMYFMLLPCVSFLFLCLIQITLAPHKIYRTMRAMSLLVYVSHIIFITFILWLAPQMNSLLAYSLCAASSLLFAYLVVWLSRRISILKGLY